MSFSHTTISFMRSPAVPLLPSTPDNNHSRSPTTQVQGMIVSSTPWLVAFPWLILQTLTGVAAALPYWSSFQVSHGSRLQKKGGQERSP